MRITIVNGTDHLLTLAVEPGQRINIQASRLVRSAELRHVLVLAIATLAEQRQHYEHLPLDVASVDVGTWQTLAASKRPRRRRVRLRRYDSAIIPVQSGSRGGRPHLRRG